MPQILAGVLHGPGGGEVGNTGFGEFASPLKAVPYPERNDLGQNNLWMECVEQPFEHPLGRLLRITVRWISSNNLGPSSSRYELCGNSGLRSCFWLSKANF